MLIMCVRCSVLRLCSQHRRAHDLNISARARRVCPRARATRVLSGECSSKMQTTIFRTFLSINELIMKLGICAACAAGLVGSDHMQIIN